MDRRGAGADEVNAAAAAARAEAKAEAKKDPNGDAANTFKGLGYLGDDD